MTNSRPHPIAFMVMPFRKRPIANPAEGAPREVDFDALWDRAFRPVLTQLGYLAIRADIETGSVIIKDMLERLAFAELVLADLTLPNANVYYEVGIRHVAQRTNCVLIAADWSKQLFDVDQMRALRYSLNEGSVPEAQAQAIRQRLLQDLPRVKDAVTPYHELVSQKSASSVFRDQIETISVFQSEIRAVRMERDPERRKNQVLKLMEAHQGPSLELPEVALELTALVRDNLSWEAMVAYTRKLPGRIQSHASIKEQMLLAQSSLGDHVTAIAGLQELIRLEGETPERRGLIGGRFKRLWRETRDKRKAQGQSEPGLIEVGYLEDAVENYRLGMNLDLNEYYCASNLPGLLRTRGAPGDAEEADFLERFIVMVTQRKITRGEDEGWARSTLLGTAFRVGDTKEVARLIQEVAREGPAAWQLVSTLQDIEDTLSAMADTSGKHQLAQYRDRLSSLLHPS